MNTLSGVVFGQDRDPTDGLVSCQVVLSLGPLKTREECVNVMFHLGAWDSCANCALAAKLVFIVEGLLYISLALLQHIQESCRAAEHSGSLLVRMSLVQGPLMRAAFLQLT